MRVEQTITIDAPCDEVWDLVTDPETYTNILAGITRFDVEGRRQRGLGARYAMRMEVGSAQIGGLVEGVGFDGPRDMGWTKGAGLDHPAPRRRPQNEGGPQPGTVR